MEASVSNFLKQADLDWSVETQTIATSKGIEIPKNIAIVRTDTQDVLSVMGDSYMPYQNEELMELLFKVSQQTGLELHRGGYFGEGQKVFVQLKSDDLKLGGDRIEGYLTGINSFDGSTSLAFGASNLTISCRNTFFSAFKQMKNKVRHTKNLIARVEDICVELENVKKREQEIFADIVRLSETRFDAKTRDLVTKKLFNIEKNVDLNSEKEVSTRTRNQLNVFYVDMNGELQQKGDNMWGLFSGVTKFTTHSLGNSKRPYNPDQKMFNMYGKREQEIFNHLVELSH